MKWRLFKRSTGVNDPCPLESGGNDDVTANAHSANTRIHNAATRFPVIPLCVVMENSPASAFTSI